MRPKILVVDDAPTVREHLRLILCDEFEVECVSGAEEALQRAAPPDLILSDLMMEGMDGAAFCRAVRESPDWADVPFVLLTAWADPSGKAQSLEQGADDYLTKPVRTPELLARVRSLIKLRQARLENLRQRDELARQRDELARQLAERKQMEEQLLFAQRMAALGTLAAGMAHEINNPLAYVSANLCMALEHLVEDASSSDDRAEVQDVLQDAFEGTKRIRDVVQGLRLCARADGAPADPQFDVEEVELESVVNFAINVSRNEVRHRARLDLELGEVPPVRGSQAKLGQVLINLLVNAAQAIPGGQAERNLVRVRLRQVSSDWVALEVSDTGTGLTQEVREHMFDPFFTTKPVGQGTGLGLSICQGIVSSHGGRIEVESELGRGTLFRVLLPTLRTPASSNRVAAPTSLPATGVLRGLAPLRILVVDDEPLVGKALAKLLGDHHQVVVVARPSDALELICRQTFDLMICDLMMPEMTGMELYQRLQFQAPELARRTLFVTGGAFSNPAAEFLAQHSDHTVFKPLDLNRMAQVITNLVSAGTWVEPRAAVPSAHQPPNHLPEDTC